MDDRLSDFTRDGRVVPLAAMAVIVGALGTVAARALAALIAIVTNLAFYGRWSITYASPAGSTLGYWVVLVPVAGGLVIGLMARYGSERIRGHGIPEALEAILIGGSRVDAQGRRSQAALVRRSRSAPGGPFGAEGPIIMTGGALGSLFAQLFHLTAAERKTLLVAGAAAGMSAIFATPVAAVLLAVELLLFEWKPRSFIPVALAAAPRRSCGSRLLGAGPVFPVRRARALAPSALAAAASRAASSPGACSGLLTTTRLRLRRPLRAAADPLDVVARDRRPGRRPRRAGRAARARRRLRHRSTPLLAGRRSRRAARALLVVEVR